MDYRILPDMMVFLQVVRAGSLTRAAEHLNTVQSNVTARIKNLERAVGTSLLRRHARGIKPTPAGEAALALALRIGAVMDDLQLAFGQGAHVRSVRLRLGAIETTAASHLPSLAARFSSRHPNVDVLVQTGSSAALIKQLKAGELDVIFISRAPRIPGFRERIVFRDELVIVAPSSMKSMASVIAPSGQPLKVLVQRLGCSYTDRLLTFLSQKSKRQYQLLELGTLEGVLGFVEAGSGIAAMPKAFAHAAAGNRKVCFFELPRSLARLGTYLVAPSSDDSSFAVNELVALASANLN